MAIIRRTAVLLAVVVLAGLARNVAARSVPTEEEYVIHTDESEVRIDINGPWGVEMDYDMDFGDSRSKRQAPVWRCSGTFSTDGSSYDVNCETNLNVLGVQCTLDGSSYNCPGIDFSVDTSAFNDNRAHSLHLVVSVRYGNANGTLRYNFVFRKRVTNSQAVTCSSEAVGENLVITCRGSGISRIDYNINGGSYTNSGSTSSFTVLGSQLRNGNNLIGLRITINGVARTASLSVQKTAAVNFRPVCTFNYESSGKVVFRCSRGSGTVAIQTVRYSINGASNQTTVPSVSEFRICAHELRVGSNVVTLTLVPVSGDSVTRIFTVTKTRTVNQFTPRCTSLPGATGNVVFSCSRGTGSQSIRTIRYSINGGTQRTASSTTGFQVGSNELVVGSNTIVVTFISSTGTTRTATYTARKTQSEVRSFSVRCGASYDRDMNADVDCSTQTPESEPISAIFYTVNGGATQSAGSVTGFEINKSQLTREVNTIVVTLVSTTSGLTKTLTLNLVRPLSLRCTSQTVRTGIIITCTSNRDASTLTAVCKLDGVRQSSCGLNSNLSFSDVSQGRHNYEVAVTDANNLTVRNLISFENRVTLNCRSSLNLGSSLYNVVCDSDRDLNYTCYIDGVPTPCPDNLHIDISQLQAGQHTLQLVANDTAGNTATATSNFSIPLEVGSCTIDDDASDRVIDWTCTTNVPGVSMLCLVDDIQLEPCLCQPSSEFFTERYLPGDHKVSLILAGEDGSSKRFDQIFTVEPLVSASSHAIEPLEFECISEPKEEYVEIDCVTNKQVSLTCFLDNEPHTPCSLTENTIAFADITSGRHTFAVVAKDEDGLVDRSEVHFEEDLDISCRGSYNPGYDVVHLACDSTRPLADTECQLGDGAATECPLPYNLPVDEFVDDLTLRVSALDNVGNSDTDELQFLTSSCEGC